MTSLTTTIARLRELAVEWSHRAVTLNSDGSITVKCDICGEASNDFASLLQDMESAEPTDAQVEAAWQELAPPNRPSHDDVRAALRAAWGVK